MAATAFLLGIDVARAGLGLAVVAGDGTVVESLRRAYGGDPDQPADPQDWWRAARTGIKELLRRAKLRPDQIRCIGVTGDEAAVLISKDGRALCPTTLGADPRITAEVDQLISRVGARNLLNLAGGPASTTATAPKLMWIRQNEKRVWHDCHQVVSAKDFLRFRLTETFGTDANDAVSTLLFSPRSRTWSRQLATLLEIPSDWLPPIGNGQAIAGRVTESAAKDSGLSAGTPVVTGAGHGAALAIACGVLAPGSAVIELGGSGAFFAPSAEPLKEVQPRLISSCHTLAGMWGLSASELAGSTALDWMTEHLLSSEVSAARRAGRDPLEVLAELAAEVQPGADGLLHMPPVPGFPGALVGLNRRHGRGHLIRAALEGGALACRQALLLFCELRRAPDHLFVAGPGANSNLWCQIMADALDRTLHAVPVPEAPAVGAAILASTAVGIHKTIEDACAKMVKAKPIYHPRRAAVDAYASLVTNIARLQTALHPPVPVTTALVAKHVPSEP